MAELTRGDRAGAAPDDSGDPGAALARQILAAVRGLRYGSVEITVHDGAVVQIERKEKFRVGREKTRPGR